MTTVDVTATHRQMSVCPVCGEWTYDLQGCGHRLPETPPWPDATTAVRVAQCGCCGLPGDECVNATWPEFQAGVATYGRRAR